MENQRERDGVFIDKKKKKMKSIAITKCSKQSNASDKVFIQKLNCILENRCQFHEFVHRTYHLTTWNDD